MTLPRSQADAMAYELDTQGRVAQRFEGRIPAEAWDAIADLLP